MQSQLSAILPFAPASPAPVPFMPPSRPTHLTPQEQQQGRKYVRRQPSEFTPLGQSLSSLLPRVAHLLTLPEVCPPLDPLPWGYRTNLFCKFHRASGHSTNICSALQNAAQDLIDTGTIEIPTPALPPHLVKPPLEPSLDTPPIELVHHIAPVRQGQQPMQR